MSSERIRINATVNEARAAAGHSKEQWDRFYFITKEEARSMSEAHPEWNRWILIPANQKDELLERINSRLAQEGIPKVEMLILKWRVSQLLRDIQRKYTEGQITQIAFGGSSSSLTPTPPAPSQSPPQAESSPSGTKYDPIRNEWR